MKVSTYIEFINTIENGPSICVFALDNGNFNEEWKRVFDGTAERYKSSMFLRFCVITRPLSENRQFLKTINNASCLIVNYTSNSAITSKLCDDLDGVPLSVCISNIFTESEPPSLT